MTHLVLATVFADRLNLNADQANLFVLQQRLKWAGHSSSIVSVSSQAELSASKANFLLLGHGSLAAWQACLSDWPNLAQDFLDFAVNHAALAVASGADQVAQAPAKSVQPEKLPRTVSEFCLEGFEGLRVLGYKNTSTKINQTMRIHSAIVTWLHGPLLAKNPALADSIICDLLNLSNEELKNENTRKIDEIVAGVWQLESPKN